MRKKTFEERVRKTKGCWLWTGGRMTKTGYGFLDFEGKREYAHRVAYFLATGKRPGKKLVMHLCDNPPCVRVSHLRLGTPADNSGDMIQKGRSATGEKNGTHTRPDRRARGERHGMANVTEREVRAIRALYPKTRVVDIARQFDLSYATVYQIATRLTWRHIT